MTSSFPGKKCAPVLPHTSVTNVCYKLHFMEVTSKSWCFKKYDLRGLIDIEEFNGLASYLIYSEVWTPQSGYHLKGYIELSEAVPRKTLRKLFPAHYCLQLEKQDASTACCCGSGVDNILGGPYEYGCRSSYCLMCYNGWT